LRSVKELPKNRNFALYTGNQILLSLKNYKDYTDQELLEMFKQLCHKTNAENLNLEHNLYIVGAK